jgi:hypothetical protein
MTWRFIPISLYTSTNTNSNYTLMVFISWCINAMIGGTLPYLWANEIINCKGMWGEMSSLTERNKHHNMNVNWYNNCRRETYCITSFRRKSMKQTVHIFNFHSKKGSFPNISHPSNYEIQVQVTFIYLWSDSSRRAYQT